MSLFKTLFGGTARPIMREILGESVHPLPHRISTKPHADKIEQALREVVYAGDGPVFGQPLVLLAFVNRSGSNLLGEYLRSAKGLGGFHEALNWNVVLKQAEELGIDSFPDYIRHLVATQGGGQGFGLKASGPQIAMLVRWNILAMFPDVKVVHIRREDIVAQSVSLHFARVTGQWSSLQEHGGPDVSVAYDFAELDAKFRAILSRNTVIEQACAAAGLDRHTVVYEQLLSRTDQTMADLLSFLGLNAAGFTLPERTKYEKQSSPKKADMIRQFRADLAARAF